MPQTAAEALKKAKFYSDDRLYSIIKLPTRAVTAAASIIAELGEPFAALIVDKDEITLVVPSDAIDEFAQRIPGYKAGSGQYRLITLDIELEPSLVGFMATVSKALADANIPILPLAAFSRDHLLVPSGRFQTALQALKTLQANL